MGIIIKKKETVNENSAHWSDGKLKSNCALKWMKMSLTSALMDMWLYIVIRGLILSGGPHCAALLNQEVFRERFTANDRCAAQAFFSTLSKHSKQSNIKQNTPEKKKTALHARRGE